MNKPVRYSADLAKLPPLTAIQRAELRDLATRSDAEIDYSDQPALDEAFWQQAVQNPFYRPTKTQTTVRLDADVLAWLKSQGRGYQTRINALLREAMLRARPEQKA